MVDNTQTQTAVSCGMGFDVWHDLPHQVIVKSIICNGCFPLLNNISKNPIFASRIDFYEILINMLILELNHVAIHVKDVKESCDFYGKKLGLQPLPRPDFDFPGAWYRLGNHQELHIIGNRKEKVNSHPKGTHFALKCESLDQVSKVLSFHQIFFEGPRLRPDGIKQIFLKDPDGHYIEFFEDNS